MARKRKSIQRAPAERIGRGMLAKAWNCADIGQWHALFTELAPELGWERTNSGIKGRCPYHDDRDPSFVVTPGRGLAHCFGSCGKVVTDPVDLVAKLKNASYTEAFILLDQRFLLGEVVGRSFEDLCDYSRVQKLKEAAAEAFSDVVDEYVRDRPEHLSYLEPGITYLTLGRGLDLGNLRYLPVSVFPKPVHALKYIEKYQDERTKGEFDLVREYEKYFNRQSSAAGSIVFYYSDSISSISKFKLRFTVNNAEAVLASLKKSGTLNRATARQLVQHERMAFVPDPYIAEKETGIFGLGFYSRQIGTHSAGVYIVEGEFDALSFMNAQLSLGAHDMVVLCAGGGLASGIGIAARSGVQELNIVTDAPHKNGDAIARTYLSDRSNFEPSEGSQHTIPAYVYSWPRDLMGDDPDDLIVHNGYEAVRKYMVINRAAHFKSSRQWVADKLREDRDRILEAFRAKVEGDPNTSGDTPNADAISHYEAARDRELSEAATAWVKCLHTSSDRAWYSKECADIIGMTLASIPEIQGSVYDVHTRDGACGRITEMLMELVQPSYSEPTTNGRRINYLWDVKNKMKVAVPGRLDHSSLSSILGKNLVDWTRQVLGNGSVIDSYLQECDGELERDRKRLLAVNQLFDTIMQDMACRFSYVESLTRVGQGVHYRDLEGEASSKVIVVNGVDVYVGTYTGDDSIPVSWEAINNATSHGCRYLHSSALTWSRAIRGVADLNSATAVNHREVYTKVRRILDGWKFKGAAHAGLDDTAVKDYMAAYIIGIPVMAATGSGNLTFVTGMANSGKSALLQGLLGGYGNGNSVPPIVESAKFYSDASAAAIYQDFDASTLLMNLDEAESGEDTRHAERIREIQRHLYNVPMGGAKVVRGGATPGTGTEYHILSPALMAAINMNPDTDFLSRVFIVQTEREIGREPCSLYIARTFTDEEIADLRRDITLGLIPHIPELRALQGTIARELTEARDVTVMSERWINMLLHPFAVLRMCMPEYDTTELLRKLTEINMPTLSAIANSGSTSTVLDTILKTPAIQVSESGASRLKSAEELIKSGDHKLLNSCGCGIYVATRLRAVVIDWSTAVNGILHNTSHRTTKPEQLKASVAKTNHVMNSLTPEDEWYIQNEFRLKSDTVEQRISVISLEYLLDKKPLEQLAESWAESEMPAGSKHADIDDYADF